MPGTGPGSVRLAARTLALADRLGICAVLANAVRYADPAQHRIADVLDAARLLRPIDRKRLDCGERWLKGEGEMAAVAERVCAAGADRGRAAALLAETVQTAEVRRRSGRRPRPWHPALPRADRGRRGSRERAER